MKMREGFMTTNVASIIQPQHGDAGDLTAGLPMYALLFLSLRQHLPLNLVMGP